MNSVPSDCFNSQFSDWPPPPSQTLINIELEAIFYPKFENENRDEKDIRKTMLRSIKDSNGYLEVSLKHSGSLILWSGYDRFYAKNSMDNKFCLVGEILLREHFVRAWSSEQKSQKNNKTDETEIHESMTKFLQCSHEMSKLNLTCSFECITSVLGDHGDIPNQDYVILTAIADKNMERFFSTKEVMQFAQKWRLPHNDVWISSSPSSADALFHLYDTSRENGLADSTIAALNRSSNYCVESMYPHTIFQGNILEGIVIRLIKNDVVSQDNHDLPSWETLSYQSKEVLKLLPPELPYFQKDLKDFKLYSIVKNYNEDVINKELLAFIQKRYGWKRRLIERVPLEKSKSNQIIDMVKNLMEGCKNEKNDNSFSVTHQQTKRIAALIQKLENINVKLHYKLYKEISTHNGDFNTNERNENDEELISPKLRWLCALHILNDSAFLKYHKNSTNDEMMLFRGFFIRFVFRPANTEHQIDTPSKMEVTDLKLSGCQHNQEDSLMLKMKFLPYMIRTFGCRNGLKILSSNGIEAYDQYTTKLMQRWQISKKSIEKWQPFFHAWGIYALPKMQIDAQSNKDLPVLTQHCYLHHFNAFQEKYNNPKFDELQKGNLDSASLFRGLVVIVSLDKDNAIHYGEKVSNQLRCKMTTSSKDVSVVTMANAMRQKVGGLVYCCDIFEKGGKAVRALLKKFYDAIHVVLLSCSDYDVDSTYDSEEERKQAKGKISYWRYTRCKTVLDVCTHESSKGHDNNIHMERTAQIRFTPADLTGLTRLLRSLSDDLPKVDDRPGMLVFFPCIPGSGKTFLSESVSEIDLDIEYKVDELTNVREHDKRKLIVYTSDKLSSKTKYWPSVEAEKLQNPSSIFFADKNAPPSIWDTVAKICASSKGMAIPIFPDNRAFQTTTFFLTNTSGAGHESNIELTYPFSLLYLAICILHVLDRPPRSHAGKLDASTIDACMVVVRFFGFYEGYTSDRLIHKFQNEMLKYGAPHSEELIQVPLCNDSVPDLPGNLEKILKDALSLRYEADLAEKKKQNKKERQLWNERMKKMDAQVRSSIDSNKKILRTFVASPARSKASFLAQLRQNVNVLDTISMESLKDTSKSKQYVNLVSIDVELKEVHKILNQAIFDHPCLQKYFDKIGGLRMAEPNVEKNKARFIYRTHVTMAHSSSVSQNDIHAQFDDIVGSIVNLSVKGFMYNEQVAALSVVIPKTLSCETSKGHLHIPSSRNEFTHITVWCGANVSAVSANRLPMEVNRQAAQMINFEECFRLRGRLSFWADN